MQNRGPNAEDQRNMILMVVICAAILLGWEFFIAAPQQRQLAAERARQQTAQIETQQSAHPGEPVVASREVAVAQTTGRRVPVGGATSAVDGTILLDGARFDDLRLRGQRETVARNSPEVTLLSPTTAPFGLDAVFGWEDNAPEGGGVGREARWQAQGGAQLTPETPLVLTTTNADGLVFTRTISIDSNYMITVADAVRNTGRAARQIRPYGVVQRDGLPPGLLNAPNVHQGFVGAFGENHHLALEKYQDAQKFANNRDQGKVEGSARIRRESGVGGWLGITDHYWLTALIPDQSEHATYWYDAVNANNTTTFKASYQGSWRTLAPGATVSYTQRLYAGAKLVELLRGYQQTLHIPDLDKAVDWGILWFLTRPFFALLHWLAIQAGHWGVAPAYCFGVAIFLSTVVIRGALFPLVYQSFKSMAKMRTLAPKMKEIQERYAADKQRQQQETIKLYQTEKINPVSGCLPLLFQMPVFLALYKTLSVTIEMRHAHFIGWIQDLSARDPTSIFNLFGLLPYNPGALPVVGAFLMVGAWPIIYGITMSASQAFAPPPTDATQAQIIRMLPLIFTFVFAGLPAGLVIYYSWSNCLTILQQYIVTRRLGQKTQLDEFLEKRMKKKGEPA